MPDTPPKELLPCPFCGSAMHLERPSAPYAVCTGDDCGCELAAQATTRRAIEKCNTRTPDPRIEKLAAALKQLLRAMPIPDRIGTDEAGYPEYATEADHHNAHAIYDGEQALKDCGLEG